MDDKLPEKDNPSAVTGDSIKAYASQKKRERSWRWLWQLVLAFVLGLLIHWLWPLARQRYPKLPEMSPEEVLAILAIAFAVVQFLDARGQEHELNAISGELRAETTNLKGQIGDLRIETANLGGQIGKLQTETTNLGTQIGDIIKRARATTRNLFGKHRALRRRWHGAQLLGWFEVDALCAEDAPLLGNERAALMADMGVTLAPAQPTYIPTIHAVVALNGLDWQEMRDAFQEKWPHEHQVDVRPFYEHQPVEKSLYCTIRYALKRSCSSFLRGADAEWPESWLVEFETWSQRWSRSFQSFRISIGKKRTPKLISTPKYTSIDEDNYIEPMPMVF